MILSILSVRGAGISDISKYQKQIVFSFCAKIRSILQLLLPENNGLSSIY
jgi:hypothetical protein